MFVCVALEITVESGAGPETSGLLSVHLDKYRRIAQLEKKNTCLCFVTTVDMFTIFNNTARDVFSFLLYSIMIVTEYQKT